MLFLTKDLRVKPESLAEFVLRKRNEKGLSQNEAAKRSGLSNAWFGRLETGTLQGVPKVDTLRKVAKGLGVDLADLMTAAGYANLLGSMSTQTTDQEEEREAGKTPKPWLHHDLRQASTGNEAAVRTSKASNDSLTNDHTSVQAGNIGKGLGDTGHIWPTTADFGPVKKLPVFRVSCGERILINDHPEEWQAWPVMWTGPVDGIMKVEGDSMLGAGINPGDLIFFQAINGHRPQPGSTVVAEVKGAAVCKIFQRADDGTEMLVSAPDDEDKRFFALVDASVRMVGIVKKHLRNI